MHKSLLMIITFLIAVLVIYNIGVHGPVQKEWPQEDDYVEYIDLGCDDSELEVVEKDSTTHKICRDIGAVCEIACTDSGAPEVQAHIGKGNTVKCRCYRAV